MRTKDRLLAVDASAGDWRKVAPQFQEEDVLLMRLIRVASLGITAFTDPILRPTGLTESSYHTLIVVLACGDGGTTPSTLCEQVGQTPANMTRILDLLATEKLIRIRPDARDARRRRVVATASGRKLVRDYAVRFEPLIRVAFGALGAAEKKVLERALRVLIESMDAVERMVGAGA